ncbi:NAD dependent epimerase/dehydratase [Xylaria bambusicola]|uniref:NAD dependent epimerase/dehydratase n=1 Tax=Xylaria bambusicola TaxID=326684 RepID=UPI0020072E4C|nr:NAD dependent epimerase/dehydratase [Xylaria bambusicola]KAI0517317.1 NAD dependent epimerase/dehydratase [Xylaria bambusicola]
MPKVLLTGGSGFIATHILQLLLSRGHEVVTTVRSEEKAKIIRDAHPGAKLTTVIVPDISLPGAFDEVMQTPGLEYVQHTASPFHFKITDPKELLDPAIKGTTSVLEAIKKYAPTVKRVVITSSFAAILDASKLGDGAKVWSEADWNPMTYEDGINGNPGQTYRASKTLAEKAAWEFVEKEKPNFDLVTINPPFVFGPVVHHLASLADINTSNGNMVALIAGRWKAEIPPTGVYLWVDVRDVAKAHVEAQDRPEAGGNRFFTTAGLFTNKEIVPIVRKNFPQLADRLPEDGTQGGDYPGGSKDNIYKYDNSKTTKMLGIEWATLEKSVTDTIGSLLTVGAK